MLAGQNNSNSFHPILSTVIRTAQQCLGCFMLTLSYQLPVIENKINSPKDTRICRALHFMYFPRLVKCIHLWRMWSFQTWDNDKGQGFGVWQPVSTAHSCCREQRGRQSKVCPFEGFGNVRTGNYSSHHSERLLSGESPVSIRTVLLQFVAEKWLCAKLKLFTRTKKTCSMIAGMPKHLSPGGVEAKRSGAYEH